MKKVKCRIACIYYFCKPLYTYSCLDIKGLTLQRHPRSGKEAGHQKQGLPVPVYTKKISIFNEKIKHKDKNKMNCVRIVEYKILVITIESVYYITRTFNNPKQGNFCFLLFT